MGAIGHDGLAVPGKVDLAHEPGFRLGDLQVEPATRQLIDGERSITLEPRVMQVLVALARANAIVTRDELIDRCWDGRAVSDDAINRVISRIRNVAADFGNGCFSLETITKVGYRLVLHDAHQPNAASTAPRSHPTSIVDRRGVIAGSALALGLGSVGLLGLRRALDRPPELALTYFERAVALRGNADAEDNRQAIAYLNEAVRIAPDFGKAWGALALSYASALSNEAPDQVAGFRERLVEAARKAEELDPGNDDAAVALLPYGAPFGRWLELERTYRAAMNNYPEHPAPAALLGAVMMDTGRWREAVNAFSKAQALERFSAPLVYKLTVSLWSAGEITQSERIIDDALRRWPQHSAIWETRLKLLALTGRPEEAIALLENASSTPLNQSREAISSRRLFYEALAKPSPQNVDAAINSTVDQVRLEPLSTLNGALACAALSQPALALDMLEGAYLKTGPFAVRSREQRMMVSHPLFQPHARILWNEPRFAQIVRAIGLADYWRRSGSAPDYRRA